MEYEENGDRTGEADDGVLSRLRQMPAGTADPNIIGNAGPTGIPPGSEPPLLAEDDALA
ncbi:MAG TPA: hypothetical protein VMZ51_04420 [Acidimicrobiales bacterium]|nr:hypothetical protein [Acidimicrobiales bacterium]